MRMLGPQEFHLVRREIDDDQAPAGRQHRGGLAHGPAGICLLYTSRCV